MLRRILKRFARGCRRWLVRAAWLVLPSGVREPRMRESERRTLGERFSPGQFAGIAVAGVVLLAVCGGPAAYAVRFATADIPLGEIRHGVGPGAVATAVLVPLAACVAVGLLVVALAWRIDPEGRPRRKARRLLVGLFIFGMLAEILWLQDFSASQERELVAGVVVLALTLHHLGDRLVARRANGWWTPSPKQLVAADRPVVVGRVFTRGLLLWAVGVVGRVFTCGLLLWAVWISARADSGLDRGFGFFVIVVAAFLLVAPYGAGGRARSRADDALVLPREALSLAVALSALILIAVTQSPLFLTAVFGALLALVCLKVAYRSKELFAPFGLALLFVVPAFVAIAATIDSIRSPSVQPYAAVTADGRLVCGALVGERGGRMTVARIARDPAGGGIAGEARLLRFDSSDLSGEERPRIAVGRALRQAAALRAELGRKQHVSPEVLYGDDQCPPPMLLAEGRDGDAHAIAKRFQPTFVLSGKDRLWPVPVSTVFSMEGRKGTICLKRPRVACRRLLQPASLDWIGKKSQMLVLPARMDRDDQRRIAVNALADNRPGDDSGKLADPQRSAVVYQLASGPSREFPSWSVQYWTYHTYNYLMARWLLPRIEGGSHQGDFEQVGVVASRSGEPRYLWMSRHKPSEEGRPFAWDEPDLDRDGDHMRVKVAIGSHASYDRCGGQFRYQTRFPNIDDNANCDGPELGPKTPLVDLATTPWACWRGTWGRTELGTLERVAPQIDDAPQGPLWQQRFGGVNAQPCVGVPAPEAREGRTEEVVPEGTAVRLRERAGRLERWFDDCEDWMKPPSGGAYLVVCDQRVLDAYFKGGLETVPAGAPLIVGAGAGVPAVRRDYDAGDMGGWDIIGEARSATVYAACRDGRKAVAATFRGVRLRPGDVLRLDQSSAVSWRLTGGEQERTVRVRRVAGSRGDGGRCGTAAG